MGVTGLWKQLGSIQRQTNVSEFRGCTVAIDGYAWLHKSVFACARDLALGNNTTRHLRYFIRRLQLLVSVGVVPYVVFDGDYLPTKATVEKSREESRQDCFEKARHYESIGNSKEAYKHYQKSVDITPEMVAQLIAILIREEIKYVVAPYEADAQMVYLEKTGLVQAIITEDSDLLVFGAQNLLTKMSENGDCISVSRKDFPRCKEICLADFNDERLRALALFSGCDYSTGIPRIGIKKAHSYLYRYRVPAVALQAIKRDGFDIPADFDAMFEQGDITFQFQRVYCVTKHKLIMLNEPNMKLSEEAHVYIGKMVSDDVAQGVAEGRLDPMTKKPIQIPNSQSIDPNGSLRVLSKKASPKLIKENHRISIPLANKPATTVSYPSPTRFGARSSTFSPPQAPTQKPATRCVTDFLPVRSEPAKTPANNTRKLYPQQTLLIKPQSIIRKRANKYLGLDDQPSTNGLLSSSQVSNSAVKNSISSFSEPNPASAQSTLISPSQSTICESVVSETQEVDYSDSEKELNDFASKFFKSVKCRDIENSTSVSENVEDEQDVEIDNVSGKQSVKSTDSMRKTLEQFKYGNSETKSFNQNPTITKEKSSSKPEKSTLWTESKGIVFSKSSKPSATSSNTTKLSSLKSFAYQGANDTSNKPSSAILSKNHEKGRMFGAPKLPTNYQRNAKVSAHISSNFSKSQEDESKGVGQPKNAGLSLLMSRTKSDSKSSISSQSSTNSSESQNYYSADSGSQRSTRSPSPASPASTQTPPITNLQRTSSRVQIEIVPRKKSSPIPSRHANRSQSQFQNSKKQDGSDEEEISESQESARIFKPVAKPIASVSFSRQRSANRTYVPSQYSKSQSQTQTEYDEYDEVDVEDIEKDQDSEDVFSLETGFFSAKRTAKRPFAKIVSVERVAGVRKQSVELGSSGLYPSPGELKKHRQEMAKWSYVPERFS